MHYYVVLFPPRRVSARTDRLRREHDPQTAKIIGSHITLAGPVLDKRRLIARAKAVAGREAPFRIRLGAARRWPRVLYLPVLRPASLTKLRRELGFSPRFGSGRWLPHLTITEYLDEAGTRRAFRILKRKRLNVEFLAKKLSLVRIPFGKAPGYGRAIKVLDLPLAGG